MKSLRIIVLAFLVCVLMPGVAAASKSGGSKSSSGGDKSVYVKGHYRNGKYVQSHYRNSPGSSSGHSSGGSYVPSIPSEYRSAPRSEGRTEAREQPRTGSSALPRLPVDPPTKPAAKPGSGSGAGPEDPEVLAARKLKTAKRFMEESTTQNAIDYLEEILAKWPQTEAAKEAKVLLVKLKRQ